MFKKVSFLLVWTLCIVFCKLSGFVNVALANDTKNLKFNNGDSKPELTFHIERVLSSPEATVRSKLRRGDSHVSGRYYLTIQEERDPLKDKNEKFTVVGKKRDLLIEISLFDRDENNLLRQNIFNPSTLEKRLHDNFPHRITYIAFSPYNHWLILKSDNYDRRIALVDFANWEIKHTFSFEELEIASLAFKDKRLIIESGCFCNGEDGRKLEIHDLEGNLGILSIEYKNYNFGPNEGELYIEDDYFWIKAGSAIRFWDFYELKPMETVPIEPFLNYQENTMNSNERTEFEDYKYMPFDLTIIGKSDVLVAHSDDEFLTLTRYMPHSHKILLKERLPKIFWMQFTENLSLEIDTVSGAEYRMTIIDDF